MKIFFERGSGRVLFPFAWAPILVLAALPLFAQDSPTPEPAPAASGGLGSTYFNPSMAVIGNFLAVGGQNRHENLPNASLRESEVSLQAVVDPYARADFFLSFGEGGVEVEEGFITFTTLPADLLVKVGRMRMAFGKVNTLHLHSIPWPDEPLPLVNLVGGEEGWGGAGASVSRIIELPGETFSELTLQAVRADNDELFHSDKRGDLAWNAHYRVFRDLTEDSNLDLGISYAQGPNGELAERTKLGGLDFVYRWKPLVTAGYRSFTLRGELYGSRRDSRAESGVVASAENIRNSLGWYLSADYQLDRRWHLGGRIEASDRADDDRLRDKGAALVLTFWPTEFSQLRGELRRRTYAESYTATEVLLQLQFAIGAHGAHPF